MNRVVYVPAHFTDVGRYEKVEVPTGKTVKTFFGQELDVTRTEERFIKTGSSDCDVHGQRLAEDIERAVAQLNHEGYEVVTITPITTGSYRAVRENGLFGELNEGFGYGFSYTKGVVITARRVAHGPI